jgi:hypothetical protein
MIFNVVASASIYHQLVSTIFVVELSHHLPISNVGIIHLASCIVPGSEDRCACLDQPTRLSFRLILARYFCLVITGTNHSKSFQSIQLVPFCPAGPAGPAGPIGPGSPSAPPVQFSQGNPSSQSLPGSHQQPVIGAHQHGLRDTHHTLSRKNINTCHTVLSSEKNSARTLLGRSESDITLRLRGSVHGSSQATVVINAARLLGQYGSHVHGSIAQSS